MTVTYIVFKYIIVISISQKSKNKKAKLCEAEYKVRRRKFLLYNN